MDFRADPQRGVVAGDIAEPGSWQDAAAGADVLVHAAAIVSMGAGLARFWRVNVMGTRHALEAAARGGVGRFVQMSSVTVFGFAFPDGIDERHPVRPNGVPYVDTKVASEQVVLQAHAAGEVACTVVRPGDVYGPGVASWTVLPFREIVARRLVLPAMGRGVMSPVYIDNLVDGLVLAAAAGEAAGRVIVLTDGGGVETRDFFGHYTRMLGRRRVPVVPTAVGVGMAAAAGRLERLRGVDSELNAAAARYLTRTGSYSIAAAREVLGYDPAVGLEEGMRRTEAWLRAEGLISA